MKGSYISTYTDNFVDLLNVDLPELRPAKIWNDIDKYRNDPVGMKRYFSRKFKATLNTEFSSKRDSVFYVSGEFDQLEERVIVNTVRHKNLADCDWRALKAEIIVTLMHEYIHYMQYIFDDNDMDLVLLHKEHANKLKQEEREYYASWSEIQAYAHCIYMEMKDRNSKKSCAEMLQHKRQYYSPCLRGIRSRFEGFDYPIRYLYREVLRWEKRYENSQPK